MSKKEYTPEEVKAADEALIEKFKNDFKETVEDDSLMQEDSVKYGGILVRSIMSAGMERHGWDLDAAEFIRVFVGQNINFDEATSEAGRTEAIKIYANGVVDMIAKYLDNVGLVKDSRAASRIITKALEESCGGYGFDFTT